MTVPRTELTPSTTIASGMILIAAALTLGGGVAAIAGAETLTANVEEIESRTGLSMFASLSTWGWLLVVLALSEAIAVAAIWRRTPNCILAGLVVSYFGLAGALFTLPIIRLPVLAVMALLLAAIYLLSYRSRRPSDIEI